MMILRKVLLVTLAAIAVAGCVERNTADERLRTIFHIPPSTPLTEQSICAAVLGEIPIGTPEAEVGPRLRRLGVGNATLSAYFPPTQDNHLGTIRIDYDSTTFGFVKNHYGITLIFDDTNRVSGVKVNLWLTGT